MLLDDTTIESSQRTLSMVSCTWKRQWLRSVANVDTPHKEWEMNE